MHRAGAALSRYIGARITRGRGSTALPGLAAAATSLYPSASSSVIPQTRRHAATNSNVQSGENIRKPFKAIGRPVAETGESFKACREASSLAKQRYTEILHLSKQGGGDKAVERHVKVSKKLLPIDRLKRLVDDGEDFLEIGAVAGAGMPYGDVPSAGLTTGIAEVCGRRCMVLINDGSVKGGTVYPITVKKQLRAQEIADRLHLPCIYFVDSGGAFLPLQSAIFPDKEHGGRVFYNEAVMSAKGIPQIALVCGNCTAGGAYVPTMASEAIIVDKIGTIYLGGPPLVKAALGEVVSAEELGGAALHCRTSGCTDYFAQSEDEAIALCRDVVTTINQTEAAAADVLFEKQRAIDEPLYDSSELSALLPNLPAETDVMYQIVARLADGSRFHEFKALYGPTIITGFAFVHGRLVGIVANNGFLGTAAAEKGAHFVQLCTQRNVPIVFLVHTNEPDSSDASGVAADVIRGRAKMMAAVACSNVPKFTFIVGDCFGFAAQAMGSRSMGATLTFAWPTGRIALMEPTAMANNVAVQEADTERRIAISDKLKQQFRKESDSIFAASLLWTDAIILPEETRTVLGRCLDVAAGSRMTGAKMQPLFRM